MAAEKRGPGRPSELVGAFADLAEILGGVEALAKEVGVTVRSIQRYSGGESVPPIPTQRAFEALARAHGLKPPVFRITTDDDE